MSSVSMLTFTTTSYSSYCCVFTNVLCFHVHSHNYFLLFRLLCLHQCPLFPCSHSQLLPTLQTAVRRLDGTLNNFYYPCYHQHHQSRLFAHSRLSSKLKLKLIYDRQSVSQSVLVSDTHLGPATNFSFSLKFPSDSCGFVIL
jgi:hypothetical protein